MRQELMRTLYRTPDLEFESHQYLKKYVDQKGSAVMLAIKRSAGDTLEVNLRNHTSERSTTALKPRADITRSPKQGYQ